MPFQRATKEQSRARVAFTGPAGSGKTYTALTWAKALGQRVALIDTERRSASLYADLFEFDTQDLNPPFHPDRLIAALREADDYDVVVVDSLSHFWSGEGGVLEIVDHAKTGTDSFRAWAKGTPPQQRMVDALLRHPAHVIVAIRSKTEYAMVEDERGKKRVEKLGLAPVQRDGIEYEWTVTLDVDMRHIAHVGKTRCPELADRDIAPTETVAAAQEFAAWIGSGAAPLPPADPMAVAALQVRLADLPGDEQGEVKMRWAAAGLPPLRHLTTAAQVASVGEIIDAVTGEQERDAAEHLDPAAVP